MNLDAERLTTRYEFFALGLPRPGGSKTPFLIRGKGGQVVYKDGRPVIAMADSAGDKGREWSGIVKVAAHQAGVRPIVGEGGAACPVSLRVVFAMPRPKGHYRSNGDLKPNAPTYHLSRPDATKLLRRLEDALTLIAWPDDSCVQPSVRKVYADRPEQVGAHVVIERIVEAPKTLAVVRKELDLEEMAGLFASKGTTT